MLGSLSLAVCAREVLGFSPLAGSLVFARFFLSHAPWSAYRCRSLVRRDERLKEDEEDAVQQISAR